MKNRLIHIDNEVWEWTLELDNYNKVNEIRIYDPDKKLHRAVPYDIDPDYFNGEYEYASIKPSYIKEYILKYIKKQ